MSSSKRLYHSVADKILDQINDGTWAPGTRLPGERELAEQFDVSRVTIREAEIALQALGYLDIRTGSGAYVLEPEVKSEAALPAVSAFELTEARQIFESEAAALAARRVDDEALAKLDELIERMASTDPADDEDSQLADREFHEVIAEASGNAVVQHVVKTLWKMRTEIPEVLEVHAAICAEEDAGQRCVEHMDILLAMKSRDPEKARDAMQEHFRRLLESMINITEEQALKELRQQAIQSRRRYLQSVVS